MNQKMKQILKAKITPVIIFILLSLSISPIYKIINAPELEEQQAAKKNIKIEYGKFNIPPGSKEIRSRLNENYRRIALSFDGTFYTEKAWEDIRDFYTEEAQRNGWIFLRNEENEKSRSITFRKGKYQMYCIFRNNKSEYVIELLWEADFTDSLNATI